MPDDLGFRVVIECPPGHPSRPVPSHRPRACRDRAGEDRPADPARACATRLRRREAEVACCTRPRMVIEIPRGDARHETMDDGDRLPRGHGVGGPGRAGRGPGGQAVRAEAADLGDRRRGSTTTPTPRSPTASPRVRDAGEVLSWFLGAGGLGRDHVLFLANLGSRRPGTVEAPGANILPTQENLDWAFQKWLPSKVQPGDLVVFYFAGRVGAVAPNGPRSGGLPPAAGRRDPGQRGGHGLVARPGPGPARAGHGRAVPGRLPAGDRRRAASAGRGPTAGRLRPRLARPPGAVAGRDRLARLRPSRRGVRQGRDPRPGSPGPCSTGWATRRGSSTWPACLQAMQKDPELGRQGFQTMGGVPPG